MAIPMVQVNVRVSPELHEAIIACATEHYVTITAVVNVALRQYLQTEYLQTEIQTNAKGNK